jgi:hypothetical protein
MSTYTADVRQREEVAHERQLAEEREDNGEKVSVSMLVSPTPGMKATDSERERGTHPKRLRKPIVSTTIPMNGRLRTMTIRMPPTKQAVPRSLFFRAKK